MAFSKKKISEIRQLHQKKFREQSGLFIVEGTKSVLEVIRSDWEITMLCALSGWLSIHALFLSGIEHQEVSQDELERVSCLRTPQEVLAVVRKKEFNMHSICMDEHLLVLDGIRDPGNMGTIIRTADWFGQRQILCSGDSVEVTNPKVIQASMGSFLRVKVIYADIAAYLCQLPKDCAIYGTFMTGKPLKETHFTNNAIVIIGNEGKGISENVASLISEKITIPRGESETESLNASIAAGILLYKLNVEK